MNERVLIAGAGAVGLTAALSLAQREIPVTVLEAEQELVREYRASTFHPPTLEMLHGLGVAEDLISQGLIAPKFQHRDREKGLIAEFDLSVLRGDTDYPFRLQIEQYALSNLLLERLLQFPNADVHFGHRVLGAQSTGKDIQVTVATNQGSQVHSGGYLIGADGAQSAVRHELGIDFEGMTYPEKYLVAFTSFDFLEHLPDISYVNYVSDPQEWFVLLRSPGIWRALFPLQPDDPEPASNSLQGVAQTRFQKIFPTGQPYPISHCSVYRVHQRIATTYRKGSVFLAGDAAHVNNPLGGMGLNGGIHDAVNLASKLTEVWHGTAGPNSLDLYEKERRPVAIKSIQAQTEQNRNNIAETDPESRIRRQEELRTIASDPVLARQHLLRTSMIDSLKEASSRH